MLAIALVISSLSMTAFAATGDANIKFDQGNTEIISPPDIDYPSGLATSDINFTDTQITGSAQTISTTTDGKFGLAVKDADGLDNSWHLTIAITDFETSASVVLDGAELTLMASSVDSGTIAGAVSPTQLSPALSPNNTAVNILEGATSGNYSPGIWGAEWDPSLYISGLGVVANQQYTSTMTITMVVV